VSDRLARTVIHQGGLVGMRIVRLSDARKASLRDVGDLGATRATIITGAGGLFATTDDVFEED